MLQHPESHDEVELHAVQLLLGTDAGDSGLWLCSRQLEYKFVGSQRFWNELSAVAPVVENGLDPSVIDVGKEELFKRRHSQGDLFRVPADSIVDLSGVPKLPAMAFSEIALASIA
jgi:hypothetical protein